MPSTPFQPIKPEKISASVIRQIELLILRGILRPGDRLPPERELSEQLDVSRPSLREALSELQERGLLVSRQGSGVYVADVLGSAFSDALIGLFATNEDALFDTIAFRRDIEAIAAARAARFGSNTDLAVVQKVFDRMVDAHAKADGKQEAQLDAGFHMAIVEASHNILLLHMMRSMYDLLQRGVFYNRQVIFDQRTTRQALLDQHAAINAAIQSRDPDAARAAVEQHLNFVEQALNERLRATRKEEVAHARLRQEERR